MKPPVVCHLFLTNDCDGRCGYCPIRRGTHHSTDRVLYADKATTLRRVREVAELCIRFIVPDGGNVLLVDWLPELMQQCREHGLHSSFSLSGPKILERLDQWGEDWLRLPELVRISLGGVDDPYRGGAWHQATVAAFEEAVRIRKPGTTLIVLTLVPGRKGNISKHQIEPILALARKHGARINLNPEFGTWFTRTKDDCVRRWASPTQQERECLDWLRQQPEVLPQSLRKLDFVLVAGGNDIDNPTCKADRAVLVISASNKVIGHCMYNPYIPVPIKDSLPEALAIRDDLREEGEPAGSIEIYCQGCWVWCYLVPSWIYDMDPAVWEHELMGA